MEISLAKETGLFFSALVLGAVLAAVYDFFRILRIAVKTSQAAVMAEDIVYFLICTFVTFVFILRDNSGAVRVYILVGEALGWVLYHNTLGSLVLSCSKGMIRLVRGIVGLLYAWILRPVLRLFGWIVDVLLYPLRVLGQQSKKIRQKLKYSLKPTRIMLYNLVNRK